MKCKIMHESKGRIRVRFCVNRMTIRQADTAEYALSAIAGVTRVQVFDRTCDIVIAYTCPRERIIRKLSSFSFDDEKNTALVPEHTGRELNKQYEEKLAAVVVRRFVNKLILPMPIRRLMAFVKAAKYIFRGLKCLLKGRLEVSVLDATAIGVSLLRGDFRTAGSVMFLLNVGDILDEWTHRKSIDDLARTMSLGVEQVWTKTADGQEVLMPVNEVRKGDIVVVRTGSMIPLDGKVISGDAMVNQASMTGESVPVHKPEGAYVYAGTVVEDGECTIAVENTAGGGRYHNWISDYIKTLVRDKDNQEYIAEHKSEFFRLWAELGLKYPDKYITAYINQTCGYWFPDVQYWVTAGKCFSEGFEIKAEPKTGIFSDFIMFYINSYMETPFLGLVWSIGMGVWVMIFMLGAALRRHKRSVLMVYFPVIGVWITLLIATPVYSEFRYIYSLFTCMPLFCVIPFLKMGADGDNTEKAEEKADEKAENAEETPEAVED